MSFLMVFKLKSCFTYAGKDLGLMKVTYLSALTGVMVNLMRSTVGSTKCSFPNSLRGSIETSRIGQTANPPLEPAASIVVDEPFLL